MTTTGQAIPMFRGDITPLKFVIKEDNEVINLAKGIAEGINYEFRITGNSVANPVANNTGTAVAPVWVSATELFTITADNAKLTAYQNSGLIDPEKGQVMFLVDLSNSSHIGLCYFDIQMKVSKGSDYSYTKTIHKGLMNILQDITK